jgi:site-specific DNA-methyltransferase (adenine-specific)
VVLDEDQADALDRQSGTLTSGKVSPGTKRGARSNASVCYADMAAGSDLTGYGDTGGASRFFYVAKAPARERPKVDGVAHPTVKPLTLMRWLCRLVTPPGGVVLEPFAGSGTTIEAALMEGFRVVAIEREDDYLPLIAARLERVAQEPDDGQLTFDASA